MAGHQECQVAIPTNIDSRHYHQQATRITRRFIPSLPVERARRVRRAAQSCRKGCGGWRMTGFPEVPEAGVVSRGNMGATPSNSGFFGRIRDTPSAPPPHPSLGRRWARAARHVTLALQLPDAGEWRLGSTIRQSLHPPRMDGLGAFLAPSAKGPTATTTTGGRVHCSESACVACLSSVVPSCPRRRVPVPFMPHHIMSFPHTPSPPCRWSAVALAGWAPQPPFIVRACSSSGNILGRSSLPFYRVPFYLDLAGLHFPNSFPTLRRALGPALLIWYAVAVPYLAMKRNYITHMRQPWPPLGARLLPHRLPPPHEPFETKACHPPPARPA
jgi:hypothetical protein